MTVIIVDFSISNSSDSVNGCNQRDKVNASTTPFLVILFFNSIFNGCITCSLSEASSVRVGIQVQTILSPFANFITLVVLSVISLSYLFRNRILLHCIYLFFLKSDSR